MRRLVSLVLAALATVAIAFPVAAVKPDRYTADLEGFVLEGFCEFDVQLDILIDRSRITDFYDKDGNLVRTQYNGSIVIRLTNLTSGKSMEANVGGPGKDIYNADGTVTVIFYGRGIPLYTDSNFTRGRFEFLVSGDFSEVLAVPKASGHTEDMCVLLG